MIYILIFTNILSFLIGFKLKDNYLVRKANKGGFADRYAANRLIKKRK